MNRRLTIRRETLAEMSPAELAGAVAAAAGDDTTFNCPTDICVYLPQTIGSRCYTTPLHNTCWACG